MLDEEKLKELDLASEESAQQIFQLLSGIFSVRASSKLISSTIPSQTDSVTADEPANHVARYRTLVEQIPAIVFMAYLDHGIGEAYVSPHIEQVLGFSQEEWLDDPIMWFRQIHPDDKVRWSSEAACMFLTGEPLHSIYRVMARDGKIRWFQCEAKMVQREDGTPWFIHGVAIDVTELKEVEERLRHAHDELEDRVRLRTAELARANEELQREIISRKRIEAERSALLEREQEARLQAEEANRVKDEFLATVSHELRNPLNVILGYASILLRVDDSEKSVQLQRAAEAIQRNALAQAQLVSDLLDLSRLQMGKLEIHRQALPFAAVVKDAVDTVRAEAQAKSITLEMNLSAEPIFVNADMVRLRQIIWNLLNNAVKFTDREGRVTITLDKSASEAHLTIEDTGEGIEPQFLPYVFEKFRQADASTTRYHGGMGIGLALVRQLVQVHEGRVEAYSAGKGQGSRFKVILPLFSASESAEHFGSRVPERLANLRVLIVDDSLDTVEVLRRLLEIEGAMPEVATTGIEALQILQHHKFDILISDISMPGMDGFELLSRIRQELLITDMPAVALTGFGRAEDSDRAEAVGFAAHLTKPVDLDKLVSVIDNLLQLHSESR